MIEVSIQYEEQKKQLTLPSVYHYNQLFQHITLSFQLTEPTQIRLYYLDNENEAIFFSSDTELAYALSYFSPLIITVVKNDSQPFSKENLIAAKLNRKKAFRLLAPEQQEEFSAKLTQLHDQGFLSLHFNFRCLLTNKGDMGLTTEMLLNHQKERADRKANNNRPKLKKEPTEKQRMMKLANDLEKTTEIPSCVTTLYIDGNNLFFFEYRKRRNMRNFRELVTEKVIQWSQTAKHSLKKIVLTFDRVPKEYTVGLLEVKGPKPRFETSDDLLVQLATDHLDTLNEYLFITSDKELVGRLMVVGVKYIMKSGVFVNLLKEQKADPEDKKAMEEEDQIDRIDS